MDSRGIPDRRRAQAAIGEAFEVCRRQVCVPESGLAAARKQKSVQKVEYQFGVAIEAQYILTILDRTIRRFLELAEDTVDSNYRLK